MTTRQQQRIIRAYEDGKDIQVSHKGTDYWWDISCIPAWDFANYNYRIKDEICRRRSHKWYYVPQKAN